MSKAYNVDFTEERHSFAFIVDSPDSRVLVHTQDDYIEIHDVTLVYYDGRVMVTANSWRGPAVVVIEGAGS